mgnify:CR=1 FL=1
MDEEELEQPKKKKITLSNFFESIVKIDKLANRALSTANSNLNLIQDQKLLIESLSMSLEGLRSDVQQINNYIIVERKIEKDAEADLRLEEEDKEQKQMMAERLKGDKGEDGDKGESGDQGDTGDTGDTGKAPPQPVESKGFLGSVFGALGPLLGGVGLQFLAPILGGAFTGLKTGGPIGALIGGPLGGALEYSGMRESLTGEKPSPKTNFFETINPFARIGGMFGRKFGKKDEVEGGKDQVKEEIKSEIKEELNLTTVRNQGQVVGGNVSQEQSDLMARDRELEMLIDSEYETGGKINYDKIAEYEKEQEEIQNKLFNLDDKDSVQPEKKENKFNLFETINPFARIGGMLKRKFGDTIDNFDGRPGSRKTKNKKKKGNFDKDGNYIGDNTTLKLIQQKKDRLRKKAEQLKMETTVNPDGSITSKGSGILIGDELYKPGEQMTIKQRLSIQGKIMMSGEGSIDPQKLEDYKNSGGSLSKEEADEYMKSENIEAGAFTPITEETRAKYEKHSDKLQKNTY